MNAHTLAKSLFPEIKFTKENNEIFNELPQLISNYSKQNALDNSDVIRIENKEFDEEYDTGRIGPEIVGFKKHRNYSYGTVELDDAGLTVVSLENFCSVRANVCVFSGKWMYETTLLTNGILQIGWATSSCPFTNEEGVGDAPDSFAYDGKRRKKWNVASNKYGEYWEVGDIIGSCIDLDNGTITFYRNGKHLGVAFNNVRIKESGLVYFPTISLSNREMAFFNFGDFPMVYPVEGYEPLQYPNLPNSPSLLHSVVGQSSYFCNKIQTLISQHPFFNLQTEEFSIVERSKKESLNSFLLLFNSIMGSYLELLLNETSAILPFFKLVTSFHENNSPNFELLFTLLNQSLELEEKCALLNKILWYISYKSFTTLWDSESDPLVYISMTLQLFKTPFFNTCLPTIQIQVGDFLEKLLYVKQPNENDLQRIFPKVWEETKVIGHDEVFNLSEEFNQESFNQNFSIFKIYSDKYFELFQSLFEFMYLNNREFLCSWLRSIVKKNKGAHQDILPPKLSNITAMTNLFIILVKFLNIKADENGEYNTASPFFEDVKPTDFTFSLFYSSFSGEAPFDNYYDLPRLGGSFTHVIRTIPGHELGEIKEPTNADYFSFLFDSMVLIYHLRVRDDLVALAEKKTSINEAINLIISYLKLGNKQMEYIKDSIQSALIPTIRSKAWEHLWIYRDGYLVSFWTSIQYIISNIINSFKTKYPTSSMTQYIPEFYIESVCDGFNGCRRGIKLYKDTALFKSSVLNTFSLFITHFNDPNIINPDMREKLLKSISLVLQIPKYVKRFEDSELLPTFIANLFQTITSNSGWYTVVLTIANFSKGNSFGIRNYSATSSPLLTHLFKEYAFSEINHFNKLLNQIFNQLNSFATEFRKEIKVLMNYAEIDGEMQRLRKRCTVIFELLFKMFCILELVANECSKLLLESQMNMTRLAEIILLFLSTLFNLPHSEYFLNFGKLVSDSKSFPFQLTGPIAGILTTLHKYATEHESSSHYTIISSLISLDASFSQKYFTLLYDTTETFVPFYPKLADDISSLAVFVELVNKSFDERTIEKDDIEDDDNACTICYNNPRNSEFLPCKHQSCELCITRHLLNSDKCFFCNTQITSVQKLQE